VSQMFMETGSSAQLSQNPINEPYRSQVSQLRNITIYILVSAIRCNIVTCRPFLGNELANALPAEI
jgi:hypothetical protein